MPPLRRPDPDIRFKKLLRTADSRHQTGHSQNRRSEKSRKEIRCPPRQCRRPETGSICRDHFIRCCIRFKNGRVCRTFIRRCIRFKTGCTCCIRHFIICFFIICLCFFILLLCFFIIRLCFRFICPRLCSLILCIKRPESGNRSENNVRRKECEQSDAFHDEAS